ncbi:MAG TPA: Rho termination factor N-terminal domain-containing protein, partial [Gemmatimonadota bacterium]|nr:Rho termination factor N-terminal domain-containing protein [Gemmatimonadota bacterium]
AIEKLVRSKLAAGKDVVTPVVERESSAAGGVGDGAVIDLMEELRRRMKSGGAPAADASSGGRGSRVPPDLESRSKQELYDLAKDLDIEGRSRMTKDDLIRAIRRSA